MQAVRVIRIAMADPADVSGLDSLIDGGEINPGNIVAVLGKTEGNGCVNDFTRGYATTAFATTLAKRLNVPVDDVYHRIAFVMSGGTEGVMSPHATIFEKTETALRAKNESKRLAIGVAFTRPFLPEDVGRVAMAEETLRGVRAAMKDAGISEASDVHFVQIKTPLLTAERMADAHSRGKTVVTTDTYKSMGYARGASALGVAAALGEVDIGQIHDADILENWDLYSSVASTSAGIELLGNEIILMGNSSEAVSPYVIGHSVMQDAIDGAAVRAALRNAGIKLEGGQVAKEDVARIANVLAKAEADPTGKVRGRRHTMLDDSDINSTRHARAVVNAVIASIVGDPMVYVSGGAEHQGPAGGGPVAVIARTE